MTKIHLLFLTIMVEGYVVLATELLAIRQLIPFVGSGVEIVAIVISGVLLPLAVGYHAGGISYKHAFAHAKNKERAALSIRQILLRNLLVAFLILSFGLTYVFLERFFGFLTYIGLTHRLWHTALYSLLFLVPPIFLLGQTVPLISNYFSRRRLSEITGKMLFFSTAGSFLGSIFSTLVLMTTIGVHNTVIVTLSLLFFLRLLLKGKKSNPNVVISSTIIMLFVIVFNSGFMMKNEAVVSDNAYNLIQILPIRKTDGRLLLINKSPASIIDPGHKVVFEYLKFMEDNFINTMPKTGEPKDILVVGAGGFTMGLEDNFNRYVFVDIDPDMKKVSEQDFLRAKLSPNKRFVPASARAFLVHDKQKYDLIAIDVFQQKYSIPMECMTREFLEDAKARLKDNGILTVNILSTPDFRDKFTVRYDRTFSSVFPVHSRQIASPHPIKPWDQSGAASEADVVNNVYIYFNQPVTSDTTIYTDDKNTYSLDRP